MKKFLVVLLALVTILTIAPAAKADTIQINGSINVSIGKLFWDATVAGGGIHFTKLTGSSLVLDQDADFNVIDTGTPVTISITPLLFGNPVGETFSFTEGANTGTFTFADLWVTLDNSNTLNYYGDGTLTLTGFSPTRAIFTGSAADSNNNYGGSGSSGGNFNILAQPIPEPGSLLLFGTGLIGFAGLLRRKYMVSR